MTSVRWLASGFLSLVLLTAAGCSSDSSPTSGAGGGPGRDGSAKGGAAATGGAAAGGAAMGGAATGGAATGGIGVGAGGGGGSVVDAGRDSAPRIDGAAPRLDGAADAPVALDTAIPPVDGGAIDAPAIDAPVVIGPDGGVTLAQVSALLAARCVGCHNGTGATATRLDLSDKPDSGSTLYERLVGPLLLETFCGESLDAGGDGGGAVARKAIIAGDPADSFLYLKILGEQPSPGAPPANCGVRMPRVFVAVPDGGVTAVGCNAADGGATANCLNINDIELVHQWILEGAPH